MFSRLVGPEARRKETNICLLRQLKAKKGEFNYAVSNILGIKREHVY